jgi:hypothetical protein
LAGTRSTITAVWIDMATILGNSLIRVKCLNKYRDSRNQQLRLDNA